MDDQITDGKILIVGLDKPDMLEMVDQSGSIPSPPYADMASVKTI